MDTLPKMAGDKKYVKSVANNYDKILGGGVAISCRGMAKIVDLIKVLVKVLERSFRFRLHQLWKY